MEFDGVSRRGRPTNGKYGMTMVMIHMVLFSLENEGRGPVGREDRGSVSEQSLV